MSDLQAYIDEGRLIRNAWVGTDALGRHTACLLAALSPEVARERRASACPAHIMRAWLAHLTPWINDAPSAAAWPGIVQRYADISQRWHVLDAAGWRRAEYRVRAAIVREAMQRTKAAAPLAACRAVIALCDRVVRGDAPSADEWAEAARWAAASGWASAAGWAARWAAEAGWAAEVASGWASAAASGWASAAGWAAEVASADRICWVILDELQVEIEKAGWTDVHGN